MRAEPERRTAAYVACPALAVVCCACACGSAPADHLVVLADDRGLQPAENVVPLVRRDVVARYGPRLLAVPDTVSARLMTGSLRALNARVELRGDDPRLVAENWLQAQGLPSMGEASR
jgi:glycine betaine/choline ABC-type transport system substrate-binding protein